MSMQMSEIHRASVAIASVGMPSAASPLVLSDRLLTLAREAGLAGLQTTADRLVMLAHCVFDEPQVGHA